MLKTAFTVFFTCLLLLGITTSTCGQESLSEFGKNRVQYKAFNWQYYSSENFDVYFYEGGKANARLAIEYLESQYDRITQDVLGYALYSKAKIFVYNSVTDLQQSNVGVNENNFTASGQTNFVKPRVEIAFPGTKSEFKRELIYKVAGLLINDMMYGGSLTDMFQSAYLFNLPNWVVEGAARYVADGWSIELDDYMRDFIKNRKFRRLGQLNEQEAAFAGHAIWNYVAEKYGVNNISNILNLTRINRSERNSIIYTLGVTFDQFTNDWRNFYLDMSNQVSKDYRAPDKSNFVEDRNKRNYYYSQVKISPNGNFLAYSQNYNGRYRVYIKELASGKTDQIYTSGYKVINQSIETGIPLLSWKDNNSLGIIGVEQGRYHLVLHEIGTKSQLSRELKKITQVEDFAFKENSSSAILSADYNGQNDLFLLSTKKNSLRRLTNDGFDDIHPRFLPNSNKIIFSSNRTTDSLTNEKVTLDNIDTNYNLFQIDLDSTRSAVERITNTLSKDIMPIPGGEQWIYYLSDQKGISNLYRYGVTDRLYNQVSNFSSSIKTFDINFEKSMVVYVALVNGADQIILKKGYNLNQNNFTPQTKRQDIKQALFVAKRIRERREKELNEAIELPAVQEITDTIPKLQEDQNEDILDIDNYVFDSEVKQEVEEEQPTDILDTDNYVFDTEVKEQLEEEDEGSTLLKNLRRLRKDRQIDGPVPYEPRVGFDNLLFSWVVDPLIGFGIQSEVQVNDLLENHKFYGGILVTTDLRSGSYFGKYEYLKDRLDFHGKFSRKTIFRTVNDPLEDYDIKYVKTQIEVGASFPLNIRSRFEVSPFYVGTRSFDLDPNKLSVPPGTPGQFDPVDTQRDYIGGRVEYVFDNSVVNGLNFEGTRAKTSIEHYENFDSSGLSFTNFKMDLRHNQKIHRDLIFATRLFYARSFGNDPKDFLLGGMSNWLFNTTDNDNVAGNPLFDPVGQDNSDILFAEYVTNMRGFNYNKFNGNNALVFNAELRFPIIKYFNRGPIASNFFRNLQLIGFVDAGSAWTGSSPLADQNSLNTEIIDGNNFKATINNFGSPWLVGYGVGARTVLLGYYLKFDVAWPYEDYEVRNPKFYFTLGFDF